MIATFVEVLFGKKIFCKITAGAGCGSMTLISEVFDFCQSGVTQTILRSIILTPDVDIVKGIARLCTLQQCFKSLK